MGIIKFLSKFGDDFLRFLDDFPGLFNLLRLIGKGYWYIVLIIVVGFLIYYVRKKKSQKRI